MDSKQLVDLERATAKLSGYVCDLVELNQVEDLILPEGETRDSWHMHISNMVGIYFEETFKAYASIDGWRTPKLTWE